MLEIALMIEGQDGLTWDHWKKIAQLCEDMGFVGLYRSDHYTNSNPPDKDSLELWISLAWLADNTQRIEFGPLVTPMSFRDPTMTARMARDVDDLSNGRLTLGLGAGWQEREHHNYGWDLLSVKERFVRCEEGVQIIQQFMNSEDPVTFEGKYYSVREASFLPRPNRPGGPPILIGGNGPKLTLPMAAKYAAEWNSIYLLPDALSERNQILDQLLKEQGRKPADVRRSMMAGIEFGRDDNEVKEIVEKRTQGESSVEELAERGVVVGTTSQVVDQLGKLAEAGLQRIMLQWLVLEDLDRLETFAKEIIPQMHG